MQSDVDDSLNAGFADKRRRQKIAFKSENIICVDSIPKKIMAPGLLRKACFHASHSGANGSALFLAAPARPKALTTALFAPPAPLHAARARKRLHLSIAACLLFIQ
ncbi:hypothetical protein [uncultured Ottowia sp.]|uniref:hypothetical protein n=1 Tax=uncultured Ottowia sp. TaxID=543067 RepID=UPI002596C280|nr:hypothetical protein [uncultured Ottowia sp.]